MGVGAKLKTLQDHTDKKSRPGANQSGEACRVEVDQKPTGRKATGQKGDACPLQQAPLRTHVETSTPMLDSTRAKAIKGRVSPFLMKLRKLIAWRYGNHFLPDSDDGRALLIAMLHFGLSDETALTDAPWLDASDLKKLRRCAYPLTLQQTGPLIGLTADEAIHCRIFFTSPVGISAEAYQDRLDAIRKAKAARRQQRLRNDRAMIRHTAARDDALIRILKLADNRCLTAARIVTKAEKCEAFRTPNGRWPQRSSLRKMVHRVLNALEAAGQITMRIRPGKRGMVAVVHLIDHEATDPKTDADRDMQRYGFCHGDSVTAVFQAKS
jgi:hypothetical protein